MKRLLNLFLVLILSSISCIKEPLRIKPGLSLDKSGQKWTQRTLERMTLEEKIGQMIGCPFSGRFVNKASATWKNLEDLTVNYHVGCFILFGGEVYETAQIINSLQERAKIPLLISADLERGLGNQISGTTLFPPVMAIGAIDSEDHAYMMGRITAIEARTVGIHMTYAPVVDVNINPDNPIINVRSFGQEPERISSLAVSFLKGCQDNGLIATAKHFPGHGDTALDSHLVLPVVSADRERLDRVELFPFKKAIEAGVQSVMVTHLTIPALDPSQNIPASLSKPVVTGLLREEMGFRGLIVTDAMNMGGVTSLYSPEEAAVLAVEAGADMVLYTPKTREVIHALIDAVKSGRISRSRINASARRILEVKARLGLHKQRFADIDAVKKRVGSQKHKEIAGKMFERAITLVKDSSQTLPLSSDNKIVVFSLSSDPGDFYAGSAFVEEIKKRNPDAKAFFASAFTGKEFMENAWTEAEKADVLVFALFSRVRSHKGTVDINDNQIQFIKQAADSGAPTIVVSFGSPYFLRHFPEIDAYICAYRFYSEAQKAAVKALFGESRITGKLPVTISDEYPIGTGIILDLTQSAKKKD